MALKKFSATDKKILQFLLGESENATVDLVRHYFRSHFPGSFFCESEANNADGYVTGRVVLETKDNRKKWLNGFFQALAQEGELSFSVIVVMTPGFLGLWKVSAVDTKYKNAVAELAGKHAPNSIGEILGKKFSDEKHSISKKALIFEDSLDEVNDTNESHILSVLQELKEHLINAKSNRVLIHPGNFHTFLPKFASFFDGKSTLSSVRNFYRILDCWDESSSLDLNKRHLSKATLNGEVLDDVNPDKRQDLKNFVDQHFIGTRPGQDKDEFFSRYDAAIDAVSSNFREDHGIYFTDVNLSRFSMWFVKEALGEIGSKYIVIDPACGSGNLVSNWRSPLQMKHKVISDLQPELLYAVEQRMKLDSWHRGKFTVIPKTEEDRGLNFIDRSADDYLAEIKKYLNESNIDVSKPIAFLCNPPYSGKAATKDRKKIKIDDSIVKVIGKKSASDSYAAFLAQMRLINEKAKDIGLKENGLLLLFTQCGWLSQKDGSKGLRDYIFGAFEDKGAFIVNAKEFFEKTGKWPIAFSIWEYKGEKAKLDKDRSIKVWDLTNLTSKDLSNINWAEPDMAHKTCAKLYKSGSWASLGVERTRLDGDWLGVKRKDLSRQPESDDIELEQRKSGLPKGDERRENNTVYGHAKGNGIGFCLDLTPCRFDSTVVKTNGEAPWFYLDSRFQKVGSNQCFSGIPDSRGYLIDSFEKFQKASVWYAIAKVIFSKGCPIWANQEELWAPDMKKVIKLGFDELAMTYVLANNSCIDVTFPADNPVKGTVEVFCRNPLAVTDSDSFWNRVVDSKLKSSGNSSAVAVREAVKKVYKEWSSLLGREGSVVAEYKASYFVSSRELNKNSGIRQIRDYQAHYNQLKLGAALINLDEKLIELESELHATLIGSNKLNYFEAEEIKKTGTED